jgi:hypothetical protein
MSSVRKGKNDFVTLNAFDGSVSTGSERSSRMSEIVSNSDESLDSPVMKEAIIYDSRKLLLGQHETVCNRNRAVKGSTI